MFWATFVILFIFISSTICIFSLIFTASYYNLIKYSDFFSYFFAITIIISCLISLYWCLNFSSYHIGIKWIILCSIIFISFFSQGIFNSIRNFNHIRLIDTHIISNYDNSKLYINDSKNRKTLVKGLLISIDGKYCHAHLTYPALNSSSKENEHNYNFCKIFSNLVTSNSYSVGEIMQNINAEVVYDDKHDKQEEQKFKKIFKASGWKNFEKLNINSFDFYNYSIRNNFMFMESFYNIIQWIINFSTFANFTSLIFKMNERKDNKKKCTAL
ncbi:hypothetical protein [Fructilactobacillus carniphilus]|uniref:DUF4131 domain-containing protein n=1 Tax=Fructilactobacillus carniphilus TaxID=2940297 RepID=A0ABY5BXQ5_9LACO|nr:hypothetical protein [Fructilactobacillus carniphilus]USS91294.1 hypothetical protein M3M37_03615 [Fructilactobacillus carniphilus]